MINIHAVTVVFFSETILLDSPLAVAPIEVLIQWFLDPHLPQIGDKYGWVISGLKKSSGSQEPLEPPLTAPLNIDESFQVRYMFCFCGQFT